MSKKLVLLDFDGTLVKVDSFRLLLLESVPVTKLLRAVVWFSVPLILSKLKVIDKSSLKERIFSFFFSGISVADFTETCNRVALKLTAFENQDLIKKVKEYQRRGDDVFIVSASAHNWVSTWSRKHGIDHVIATELEIQNGFLTGKFSSPNCVREEKVRRILSLVDTRHYDKIIAFGDSKDDLPMFGLAHEYHWVR